MMVNYHLWLFLMISIFVSSVTKLSVSLRVLVSLPKEVSGAVSSTQQRAISVEVPQGSTVRYLKQRIERHLPSTVPTEYQMVEFNGTTLKDETVLDSMGSQGEEELLLKWSNPWEVNPIDRKAIASMSPTKRMETLMSYTRLLSALTAALSEESMTTLTNETKIELLPSRLKVFLSNASCGVPSTFTPNVSLQSVTYTQPRLPRTLGGRIDHFTHYYCDINYGLTLKIATCLAVLTTVTDDSNAYRMRVMLRYGLPALILSRIRPIRHTNRFMLKAIFGALLPSFMTHLLSVGKQEALLFSHEMDQDEEV